MSWSSTSAAWERVSPGWTASDWGDWYSDHEAQRIQAALSGNRRTAEHWHDAYVESRDDALAEGELQQGHIQGLAGYLSAERLASDEAISIATKGARAFGVGIFAGVGIVPGGFEPVVGAGIVWRVW